jgi:PAS domain S-box-containing protein
LDALPLAVLIRDRAGRVLYCNDAGAPGYGLKAAEIIGRDERDILPPGNDLKAALAAYRSVIDRGVPMSVPDLAFHASDGHTLRLTVHLNPVRFAGQPAVMVNSFDSTQTYDIAEQRSKLERRIANMQRTESLGLMAGGIAHDFNNLLVSVFVNADLVARELGDGSPAQSHMRRLRTAADRLAELSRQMLSYSGRGHVEIELVDVSALAAELLDLLHATLPPQVKIETSLPPSLMAVAADRSQLTQVIMNLVTNAAEALGERGGLVRVETRHEFVDSIRRADLILRSRREAGECLCIEVSDDGPGMDRATRARIFDPFYTTKATGRGLGLASVLGIVRAHDGALHVDTEPGCGTRVKIWLPPLEAPLTAGRRTAEAKKPAPAQADQSKRVLVVDDDAAVRDTTTALLLIHGFQVETAHDGEAAIERAERAEGVDVVLLDITMPGPPTREVHARLRQRLADVPILLMSGYSEPDIIKDLLNDGATHFIQKPFSAEDLIGKLRELLERPRSQANAVRDSHT